MLFGILFYLREDIGIAQVVPFQRFDLLLYNLEDYKQSRNNEYLAYHTDEHTAYRAGAQSAVTVGSYATGKHHRQQTDNHSQRGHQDRTQTCCRSVDSRIDNRHTRATTIQSELHDKNGVLGQQTDKHNQCNLQIDVVFHTHHQSENEATGQTERYPENYRQRQHITFVLGA